MTNTHINKISTKAIITFLSLILTLNDFIFNCPHYLQVMGCTMGTICTPAHANIFYGTIWRIGKSLLFLRYIDDIFMNWNGTKE